MAASGPPPAQLEAVWMRFTPDAVDLSLCRARTWSNGLGGQCTNFPLGGGGDFCGLHKEKRLEHGRVDGPIPEDKLREFEQKAEAAAADELEPERRAPKRRRLFRLSTLASMDARDLARFSRDQGFSEGLRARLAAGEVKAAEAARCIASEQEEDRPVERRAPAPGALPARAASARGLRLAVGVPSGLAEPPHVAR
ncbi:unnamed protein product [Prorocentrum cordatum]|uniref:Uncharacterized protein n=1 Tax=Prorocentrum cordatum TaxID=2364126 RepID=A0ABN9QG14_9DINO|nr:unnamed protein product [Polarella glacialis]